MEEKELEAFTKRTFQNIELDEPSTNFDYRVMEQIKLASIKISAKPILSPFKWTLVGLFIFFICFAAFYFNSGSSRLNFQQVNEILNKIELNYATSIAVIMGGTFILIQVFFLKKLHKKSLAN